MRIGCSPMIVFFSCLVVIVTILVALSNPFYSGDSTLTPRAAATQTAYAGCSIMDPYCYRALSLPSSIAKH